MNYPDYKSSEYPSVSIIIPVYNNSEGLKTCLDSLTHQTYPQSSYNVIVVDNASAESVQPIVEQYPVAQYVYEGTAGSYSARNTGLKHVNGNIIAFLDADCHARPDWLVNGVKAVQANRCIVGGEVILTASPKPTAVELYQKSVGFQQRENIESKEFSVTANLFIEKIHAKEIGPFDASLFSGGDRAWCWHAISKGFEVVYAQDVIVETPARRYLSDAIKQARRVAGGRKQARKYLDSDAVTKITPHRTPIASFLWIANHNEFTAVQKVKVLAVACFLKFISIVENFKLDLGFKAERV